MTEIEHVAMVLHGKFGRQVGLNEAEQWVPISRAAIEADFKYHVVVCEAAESALAWLERWAMHVGKCPADENCTCGLTAVRHGLILSLQPKP